MFLRCRAYLEFVDEPLEHLLSGEMMKVGGESREHSLQLRVERRVGVVGECGAIQGERFVREKLRLIGVEVGVEDAHSLKTLETFKWG